MTIKFNGPGLTKHGGLQFAPGVALAFEDEAAEPYFIAAGFAEETSDEPVVTYAEGSVEVDPDTRFGQGPNRGALVIQPDDGQHN